MSAAIAEPGVAEGELRSFVERLLRLHEEKDGLLGDIKDVYQEARSRGFDKTALGRLITHIRKAGKGAAQEAEVAAIFDLYLEAWERSASHAHAPARARETRAAPPGSHSHSHDHSGGACVAQHA